MIKIIVIVIATSIFLTGITGFVLAILSLIYEYNLESSIKIFYLSFISGLVGGTTGLIIGYLSGAIICNTTPAFDFTPFLWIGIIWISGIISGSLFGGFIFLNPSFKSFLALKYIAIVIATCLLLFLGWKFQIIDPIRFSNSVDTWQLPKELRFITFSPNGTFFINSKKLINRDGRPSTRYNDTQEVEIRKVSNGELIRTLNVFSSKNVVLSSDGSLLASASNKTGQIQVWRISDGQLVDSINIDSPSRVLAVSSDGQTIVVSVSQARKQPPTTLYVWNVVEQKSYILSESSLIPYDMPIAVIEKNRGELLTLEKHEDGLYLYRLKDKTFTLQLDTNEKSGRCLKLSPNGKLVAFWSSSLESTSNGSIIRNRIYVHNIEDGKLLNTIDTYAAKENFMEFVFTPDSQYIAASYYAEFKSGLLVSAPSYYLTSHGRVRLWRIKDGKKIKTFRGHKEKTIDIASNYEKNLLVTYGGDGKVRFWQISPRNYSWLWLLGTVGLATLGYCQRAYLISWIGF
ncbi:WD40 repeat domain-containing protein [Myxosarcina sp. GI1]|uniref:WD40 repeat domain-containing protein n=1 Tax=Myxosarcina sp. GI1 TaxID=1541065 RepID=UPI00055A70F6|nr:hypothetical protein [Myxosarcina sp. GI1]